MSEWNELVAQGRKLSAKGRTTNWELADLLLRACPMTGRQGKTKAEERTWYILQKFQEEANLDHSVQTLEKWRLCAHGWPPERRVEGCSMETHYILRLHPRRFHLLKPGMSLKDARLAKGPRTPKQVRCSFADSLRFLDASAGFLRTAIKALGESPLDDVHAEQIGERVVAVEAAFEEFLEFVGMDEMAGV